MLVLALALAGCGGDGGKIELTAADSGGRIEASTGDTITITLDSNVTTGFQWNLVTEPDGAVAKLVSSEYVPPEDGLIGEGGVEIWTFEAVAPGETDLGLSYFRPFEPESVDGTFAVTVAVAS